MRTLFGPQKRRLLYVASLFGLAIVFGFVVTSGTFIATWEPSKKSVKAGFSNSTRLFCVVITHEENLLRKAYPVSLTWGPKCDKTVYITDKSTPSWHSILPVIVTGRPGRTGLWSKTRQSVLYFHRHLLNDFDWFVKVSHTLSFDELLFKNSLISRRTMTRI